MVTAHRRIRQATCRRLPWGTILRRLPGYYSHGNWRVPVLRRRGADPFLVLVSTILSHRTRDEVTERATLRLLSEYPTPFAAARAQPGRLRSLIREVGLSDAKAWGIQQASRVIVDRFGGKVPLRERDLLDLPMVGPKTAHAIRVFGHRKPGLPVDVHILRVTRRLGAVRGRTISEAQRELAQSVPRRYWMILNPILVQHGQNLCRYRAPRCGECPIADICEFPRASED